MNYRIAIRFFEEQVKKEGIDRLRALYKALLESMSVVQIDVWDPRNGPKTFDSLNSRQEPMTTGDLECFKAEEHEKFKDLLANLLPLSQEMNQSLGNSEYKAKRPIYAKDSGFKAARVFAEEYSEWNPLEPRRAI